MTSRLLPFLALVAAVGIFFAYVNPLWNGKIASAKAGIASDDQALASAAAYVKRENELASQMNAIDPTALARLTTFLPDSVDNVGLILDLNALAARSGLTLSSLDVANASSGAASTPASTPVTTPASVPAVAPATTASGPSFATAGQGSDPVGTVDLTIAAKGTYGALQSFLKGIEFSERLLDVRDITITGSDSGLYTYQMTLRLYWLR